MVNMVRFGDEVLNIGLLSRLWIVESCRGFQIEYNMVGCNVDETFAVFETYAEANRVLERLTGCELKGEKEEEERD